MDNNENKEMQSSHDELLRVKPSEDIAASKGIRQSFRQCFEWFFRRKTYIVILILVISNIGIFIAWLYARNKPVAGKSPTSPLFPVYIISCPKSWVPYEGRCYYFSTVQGTWDFSQRQCSSFGASLASIDTQQDLEFMMRYKSAGNHYWIGLRRNGEGQPWKWTNHSDFNHSDWFPIKDEGFCAYVNDKGAFSTKCDTEQNWICTKPLHHGPFCEKLLGLATNTSSLDSDYQLVKINCLVPES